MYHISSFTFPSSRKLDDAFVADELLDAHTAQLLALKVRQEDATQRVQVEREIDGFVSNLPASQQERIRERIRVMMSGDIAQITPAHIPPARFMQPVCTSLN